VPPSIQPIDEKPITDIAAAPATAPQSAGFIPGWNFIGFTLVSGGSIPLICYRVPCREKRLLSSAQLRTIPHMLHAFGSQNLRTGKAILFVLYMVFTNRDFNNNKFRNIHFSVKLLKLPNQDK